MEAAPAPRAALLASPSHQRLAPVFARYFPWARWEEAIRRHGIVLDRPRGASHPRYPEIVYPLDYGYVRGTSSGDGEAVDVFVGSARTGLVGAVLTCDHRRLDREVKLLLDVSPGEIYLANGFLNFDRTLLEGVLVLRYGMGEIRRLEVAARRDG